MKTTAIATIAVTIFAGSGIAQIPISGIHVYCLDATTSTTTYSCPSPSPPVMTLNGLIVTFVPQTTNSGTSALSVSGFPSVTLKQADGTTNFSAGALVANEAYLFSYDGTNTVFRLQSGGSSGTVTVVGGGSLGSTELVTGGGSQTVQTPCSSCTLSSAGALAVASVATGSSPPSATFGSGGGAAFGEGTAATALSGADIIYADTTRHTVLMSSNGGNFYPITTSNLAWRLPDGRLHCDLGHSFCCIRAGHPNIYRS